MQEMANPECDVGGKRKPALYAIVSRLDCVSKTPIAEVLDKNSSEENTLDTKRSRESVLCVKWERLMKKRCVAVDDGDWHKCEFRYNTVAALYRIGIIPDLRDEVFRDENLYQKYCSAFFDVYKVSGQNIGYALSRLFDEMVFLLSLFGFAVPRTECEQSKLKNAQMICNEFNGCSKTKLIEEQNVRYFAFTEIKFAIRNYNNSCFPGKKKRKGVIDFDAYNYLQDTLIFLKYHLIRLNYIQEKYFYHDDIIQAVHSYQMKNGIPVGNCDFWTLRHILDKSMGTECSLYGICNLCGINISFRDNINFNETIEPVKNSKNEQKLEMVATFMNDIFKNVYTHAEIADSYITTLEESVEKQVEYLSNIKENMRENKSVIDNINKQIIINVNNNTENKKKVNKAIQDLDEIIKINEIEKKTLMDVQKRIQYQAKGNLFLLSVLLFLVYIIVFS